MKYVLLGTLDPGWASKQTERTAKAKKKLDTLGIKLESVHYTQGYYDFVDVVDSPDPDAMLLEFLQSTYVAAATTAHWDREALERPHREAAADH